MGKVLIIGGGLAGAGTIVRLRKINKECEIILVEPKEYSEVFWAAYRVPFEEWVAKGALTPLASFCEEHQVTHIKTTVKALGKDKAELTNGETVEFDACVVATGATSKWAGLGRGPDVADGTIEGRLKMAKEEGERILNAGSVLIVGGGLIGTELAGDIMGYAKKAEKPMAVTLVHSEDHLCPEMNAKAAKMVKKQLEKAGVKVILNERATEKDGKYTLKSGDVIEAKEVIMTVGFSACNDFFKAGGLSSSLTETGWVDADDYFRVKDAGGKILAIGDCGTTLPNSGNQILENIAIIGHNVDATLKAVAAKETLADITTLKEKKLGPSIFLVTTGPSSGVACTPLFNTTWFLPRLKNRTMFFFRPKMEVGLKGSA